MNKMIKKALFIWILCFTTICHASINAATIAQDTLAGAGTCLRYQFPTQSCVWLSPHMEKNFTPLLDHYLPDLVVVVYRNADEDPWQGVNKILDSPSAAIQSHFINNIGSGNHTFLNVHEQEVIFKEADVIGNPTLIVFYGQIDQLLLRSTAIPLKPYYQSMLDSALWRGFMPQASSEEGAAFVLDIVHHIGTGINDWGGLYPHEGTVQGNNDLKASMVIAQRATDLLTNEAPLGHLHLPLSNVCGKHCRASSIKENSDDTLFQMVYPTVQTDCAPLGSDQSYSDEMLSEKGAYVWIVWRHYQGCPDGNGTFIGVI